MHDRKPSYCKFCLFKQVIISSLRDNRTFPCEFQALFPKLGVMQEATSGWYQGILLPRKPLYVPVFHDGLTFGSFLAFSQF